MTTMPSSLSPFATLSKSHIRIWPCDSGLDRFSNSETLKELSQIGAAHSCNISCNRNASAKSETYQRGRCFSFLIPSPK